MVKDRFNVDHDDAPVVNRTTALPTQPVPRQSADESPQVLGAAGGGGAMRRCHADDVP